MLDLRASQGLVVWLFLFWSRLLGGLKAGVGSGSELVLELFDPTCGVHEFELAGVERVANVANVNLEFLAGAPGREAVTAATGDLGFEVFWVDAVFHGRDLGGECRSFFNRFVFRGRAEQRFIDEIPVESTSKRPNWASRRRGISGGLGGAGRWELRYTRGGVGRAEPGGVL